MKTVTFESLLGKTLTDVIVDKDKDEIFFVCDDDTKYKMYHDQDCCETVTIENICGDITKLRGKVLHSEEATADLSSYDGDDSQYTFYRISTNDAQVTIRWYGESSYYSTSVDFEQI